MFVCFCLYNSVISTVYDQGMDFPFELFRMKMCVVYVYSNQHFAECIVYKYIVTNTLFHLARRRNFSLHQSPHTL